MKKTQIGDRLPCGMVSLKMFHIPHSKALIIAYLDLRSGPKFKHFMFNQTDISNRTNIGLTVVRQYLKELVREGVLIKKKNWKSFYKLDRQKMEALYYNASESDLSASDSDFSQSETNGNPSESDVDASESDAIHSSLLNSSELDSSELHNTPELNERIPTVSGLGGEPLEKVPGSNSGPTARATTAATDPKRRLSDSESPKGENHPQPSLTVPGYKEQAAERRRKELRQRLYTVWLMGGRRGEWPPYDLDEQVEEFMRGPSQP